jgi:DNA-binding NarL/FixJ family response regulator
MDIKVCLIEDHKQLRESLGLLIENTPGLELVGVFSNANNVEKDVARCAPDVVLLDIQMPGLSGIEAISIIKKAVPGIKIVMQTVFEDEDKIFASICAGASGYILKNTSPEKYIDAIRDAHGGGAPMTGMIAAKVLHMFRQQQPDDDRQETNLSEREKEILQHLVAGSSYKMIADQCNISYDTVRFHMKNIYGKLHVSSMTEAVAKAIKNKLV